MFFKKLLNRVKKRNASLPLAGRMGGGFLPRVIKNRPFFRNLSRTGMMRSPLMMRGNLDDRIADRMRRGLAGMLNPNMQFALGDTPSMKARMLGLPDTSNFDANNLPVPALGNNLPMATPGRRSDIMPRDGMMPKQPPQLGLAPQMPGVPPRGSGLPPMPNPMMGINMGMPNYMSSGQPPKMAIGMKEGGEADKKQYPNAGLAALAEEAPEVVKRMGYAPGGEAISLFEIYQRLNRSMGSLSKDEMDLLKDLYSDGRFSAGDMMQKVKDFRAGTFTPRKFEDLETKTNRLSRTMGTGETARAKTPNRLSSLLKGGLGTITKLPKVSVPSALAGFGAGYLLDNMFADEPEQEMPIMPRGESMEIIPNRDMSNSQQYDGFNVGRTISEQDRQLVKDTLGITNIESISDRDIYYLLQSIQNNPNLQNQIDGLLD